MTLSSKYGYLSASRYVLKFGASMKQKLTMTITCRCHHGPMHYFLGRQPTNYNSFQHFVLYSSWYVTCAPIARHAWISFPTEFRTFLLMPLSSMRAALRPHFSASCERRFVFFFPDLPRSASSPPQSGEPCWDLPSLLSDCTAPIPSFDAESVLYFFSSMVVSISLLQNSQYAPWTISRPAVP